MLRVGNNLVGWIDFLGLRALTPEELAIVFRLNSLALVLDAPSQRQRVRAESIPAVIKDYSEFIQGLPGIDEYNTHRSQGVLAFDDYQWKGGEKPYGNPKLGIDLFDSAFYPKLGVLQAGYRKIWQRI